MKPQDLIEISRQVRENRPLVHHITNYVTVNDCANITLCAGGAPVMADAPEEVAGMTGIAGSLVLNIGTLNRLQIESMILAGQKANEMGIPIILDPVGVGATRLRTDSAVRLLEELDITILKGNAGEIGVLAGAEARVRGVDSDGLKGDPVSIARDFAKDAGLIVAVSGVTDIVTDGNQVYLIENGDPMMGRISGTGCMAASVIGVYTACGKDRVSATAAALAAFGIAGEKAAAGSGGPMSFKIRIFDELAALTPENLAADSKIRSK